MFGLFTPISYNTNLSPILAHYYMGFCTGNCPSYASLFNPAWVYQGGIGVGNPYFYNSYQCGNYYPSIYALNYSTPTPYYNYLAIQPRQVYPARNNSKFVYYPPETDNKTIKNNQTSTRSIKQTTSTKTTTNPNKQVKQSAPEHTMGDKFIDTARKYSDCSEYDGSHKKFCINPTCKIEDPENKEWCTDFVTYVVKETYKNNGQNTPAGFGNHDVRRMKNWAINTGCFIRTSNKSQKGNYISENIKPGDIMIINENGASHTGFVTKIEKDSGIIHTIEGNREDRVREYSYSPNYPDLSGFIRLAS